MDYDELVPFNATTNPELKRVYKIIGNYHSHPVNYTLNEQAHKLFKQYHDELKRRKLVIEHDENRHGIIAKAIGQMTPVSMIMHVLNNAVAITSQELESNEEANNVGISSGIKIFASLSSARPTWDPQTK